MSPERRKGAIAGLLVLVMAALWLRLYQDWGSVGSTPPSAAPGIAPPRVASSTTTPPPSVDLAALEAERPAPGNASRNPFRFGGRDLEDTPASGFVPEPPVFAPPPNPAAAEPTLSLKLIGIVQPLGDSPRVAVLSDERGVYHGAEGATIEGRYRIARIDAQSVEIRTLDGDGVYLLRLPPT